MNLGPQGVGIGARLSDQTDHQQHVVGNLGINAPKVRQVEAAAACGIPPREQETGHSTALAGIAHRDVDEACKDLSPFLSQRGIGGVLSILLEAIPIALELDLCLCRDLAGG
ncbi:hypothetical protein D3C71_1854600 [compost metagenome]